MSPEDLERSKRIERNLEFLAQQAAKHDAEVIELRSTEARAWNAIERLADKQIEIDDALESLTDSIAQVNKESAERDRQLGQRISEIAQESAERDRQLGQRISDLTSAIGQFIRQQPPRS